MKEVLELIEQKKQEFAKLPFFEFLQDKSIDPRQRLVWAPCFVHVAMSFAEFNKYFLRKEPTNNPVQEIVNQHTYEDDFHWKWYLDDLEKLGFNYKLSFIDTLRFIWSEATHKTRILSYELFNLCSYNDDPILKLTVIEAVEGTSQVGLPITALVAQRLQQITNEEYLYFNNNHLYVEANHTIGTYNTHISIENIKLTEQQKREAFEIVHKIFSAFSECFNELAIYAQNNLIDDLPIKASIYEQQLILGQSI